MFASSDGVRFRRIYNGNPFLRSGVNVDTVNTNTGAADNLQLVCFFDNLSGYHRLATGDNAVIIGDHVTKLVFSQILANNDFVILFQ